MAKKRKVPAASTAGIADPEKIRELTRTFFTAGYGATWEEPVPDGDYILQTSLEERLRVAQYLTGLADKFDRERRSDLNIGLLDLLGDIGVKLLGMNPLTFNPSTYAASPDAAFHVTITPSTTTVGAFDVALTHPPAYPGSTGGGSGGTGSLLQLKPGFPLTIQISNDNGTTWTDFLTLTNGTNGAAGAPGDLLQLKPGFPLTIQISHDSGATWTDFITLTNGATGATGATGAAGSPGDKLRVNPTNDHILQISHDNGVTWPDSITVHDGTNGSNGSNGTNGTNGITPDPFTFIFDLAPGSAATVTRGSVVDGTSSVTVHAPCGCEGSAAPPPVQNSDTTCKQAAAITSEIHDFVALTNSKLTELNTIVNILSGCIAFLGVVFAGTDIVPILSIGAITALHAVVGDFDSTWFGKFTGAVYSRILCIVFCNQQTNGSFTDANVSAIIAAVNAESSFVDAVKHEFVAYFTQLGAAGLTNAYQVYGTATADCSGCDCPGSTTCPPVSVSGAHACSVVSNGGDSYTVTQTTGMEGDSFAVGVTFSCPIKLTLADDSTPTGTNRLTLCTFEGGVVPSGWTDAGGGQAYTFAAPQAADFGVTGARITSLDYWTKPDSGWSFTFTADAT